MPLMDSTKLKHYIAIVPKTPGVYTWRDAHGKPIYIGKAANLKSRLSNYQNVTDSRIGMMIQEAD